jgi:uncharacterized membrane protein
MGFLIGIIVGVVGFRMIVRARKRRMGWAMHGPAHSHSGRGFGRRWLFEDRFSEKATRWLQLSPSQETEFRKLVSEVSQEMRGKRGTLDGMKRALGEVFSEDEYDTEKVADWISKQDAAYEAMRDRFLDATTRLHGLLDPTQRRRLAHILSRRGPGFGMA